MIRFFLIALLLLSTHITTLESAHGSLLHDNWLSREYERFRTYPRLDRAYKKIKAKQYDKALPLLQKVLDIEPENREANQVLLQVCLETRDYDCVISQTQKWEKVTPDNPIADYYSALAYQQTGQIKISIQRAKAAYQHDTLSHERRIVIGRLLIDELIQSGRIQEALQWGEKIQKETPFISRTDVLHWAGQLTERGFYSDANILYNKLPPGEKATRAHVALLEKWGKPGKAAELLEGLSKSQARYKPEYWLQLAYLYEKSANTEAEFRTLRKGIVTVKNNKTLYKVLLNRLIKLDRLKGAGILAQEELAQHGNNPKLRRKLADLLLADKKYTLALKQIHILMSQTTKDSTDLHVMLAFLLTQTKQWDKLAELQAQSFYINDNYQDLLSAVYSYNLAGDDRKRRELLEANFPFTNVPPKHRDYLTLELLNLYLAENKQDKAVAMIKTLLKDNLLTQTVADQVLNIAQKSGKCDVAVSFAERLMLRGTATGRTYLVAGYCSAKTLPGIALEYFLKADKQELLASERTSLYRSVGFLYAKEGNNTEALSAWKKYFQENQNDIDTSLSAVLLALSEKDYVFTESLFADLATRDKTQDQLATYLYALGLQAQQQGSFDHAKILYEVSSSLKESSGLYELLAQVYRQLDNKPASLNALDKAIKLSPTNSVYLAERGYLKDNMGDINGAIGDMITSYNTIPNRTTLLPNIAYDELQISNRQASLPWFYKAVDAADSYPQLGEDGETQEEKVFKLRRTIQTLEDQWAFNLTALIRLDDYSQNSLFIPPVAYAGYGGFYSGEISYRVENLPVKSLNGRLQFYSRFLQGTEDQSFETTDTLQLGLGVRYQILADQNVNISIERIIGVDDTIDDEWMFRFSGSLSEGGDWEPSKTNWLFWEAYADLAYTSAEDYLYSTLNLNLGRQIKFMRNTEFKYSFVPYLTCGYSHNNANKDREDIDRLDIGLGLGLFSWHNESKYRAPSIHSKLRVEGRAKVSGNTKDDQTVRLIWELFF